MSDVQDLCAAIAAGDSELADAIRKRMRGDYGDGPEPSKFEGDPELIQSLAGLPKK